MQNRRIISYSDSVTDVLTVAQAKSNANIVRTDQDTDILRYIEAAIDRCSNYLGFSLRRAVVEYEFGLDESLKIPANILAIDSVKYRNDSYSDTALQDSDYELFRGHIPEVYIINTPSSFSDRGYAYKIRVVEGYYISGGLDGASTADYNDILPAAILSAIHLVFVHIYQNRADITTFQMFQLPMGAETLLHPYAKLRII